MSTHNEAEGARLAMIADLRRAGKPIPTWLESRAGQSTATQAQPTDLASSLRQLMEQVVMLDGVVEAAAERRGLRFVEVDDRTLFAEPTSWNEQGSRSESDLEQQIETASKAVKAAKTPAEFERAEAKLQALVRERTRQLLGATTPGLPMKDLAPSKQFTTDREFNERPFNPTEPVTEFAEPTHATPTPVEAEQALSDEGHDLVERPRGDERMVRRRKLRELYKKLGAMTFADRKGRAGEALRDQIETLHEEERRERNQYRKI